MINSYNPNPVIIHCGLLRKRIGYSLFIWGEQKKHKKYVDIEPFKYPFLYSPFELKLSLFRNHQPSFYGTFIETSECHIQVPLQNRLFYSEAGNVPVYHVPSTYETHLFPINGLEISIAELDQFVSSILQLTTTSQWKLADDFQFIQAFLKAVLQEIQQGNIIPNENGEWETSNFPYQQWEDSAPTSTLALHPANYSFNETAIGNVSLKDFSIAFTNAYIHKVMNSDHEVKKAYDVLIQNQSKNVKNMLEQLQEDAPFSQSLEAHQQFLENIGAVEVAPFKLGIRVEEKKSSKDDHWLVTLFIQDRNDPTLMIDVSDLLVGHHPWRENPITFFNEALIKGKNHIHQFNKFSLTSPSFEATIDEVYDFLTENEEAFNQLGIKILVPSWWHKKENDFSVTLTQKDRIETRGEAEPLLNWQAIADFNYSISVGGITVSEKEFQQLVDHKRPIVKLRGNWVYWDVSTAEKIQSKLIQYKEKKKLTYMDAYQIHLEEDKNIKWETQWNDKINELLEDLAIHTWKKRTIPKALNGALRAYQQDGYSWLLNMRKIGFGACLADDMGLGKTIQTITYLLAVKEARQGDLNEPFLLICPTSLIGNWEHEINTFAPSLNIYVHHGQNRSTKEQLEDSLHEYDIVITSYSLSVRDEALWMSRTWEALILDEAQHVKNIETKQRRSIKQINAVHRIALTGTPIENRLKEMWSIIDLLNDHFLGSYQQFSKRYIKEIEGEKQNKERLQELKQLISPFLLRRTKQDKHIHLQLPSKKEIIHRVGLTVEQASLYQAVINDLFDKIDQVSEMERRALILSSLTKLKQVCNHPVHYLKNGDELENRSEKWEKLMLLAETIESNQEKALIFSQYKEMGAILKKGLEAKFNTEIPFLHGSLERQKREALISKFTNEDIPFFILSLKAGGVGLNLTAATHVIHYDRWWNPAVENQATDRAYRIGQTEDVTVHKLLTKGTLEEKIHLMLEKKQALSDQLLNTNENKLSELSTDDLEQFLTLRVSNLS